MTARCICRGRWSGLPLSLPGPHCGPPRQAAAQLLRSLHLPQAALPCRPHRPEPNPGGSQRRRHSGVRAGGRLIAAPTAAPPSWLRHDPGLPLSLPGPRCGPPRQAAAQLLRSLFLPQAALPCRPPLKPCGRSGRLWPVRSPQALRHRRQADARCAPLRCIARRSVYRRTLTPRHSQFSEIHFLK